MRSLTLAVIASIRSASALTLSVSSVFWRNSAWTLSVSVGVLAKHVDQQRGLLLHLLLALLGDPVQLLAVLGVGDRMRLVAIGLARFGEQDQRRRIGRLQRKGEVEQDEGIDVERRPTRHVDPDPHADDDRLGDKKGRRAEEAGEGFRLQREPVAAENGFEMGVRQMKPPRPVRS